jgi:hypothetical protein
MSALRSRRAAGLGVFLLAALCCEPAAAPAQTPAPAPPRDCPLHFKHPGILTDMAALQRIKDHIARGEAPWKPAYDAMARSRLAALDYKPQPYAIVSSGINNSHPQGTVRETQDSYAAYTQTLMWIFTGNVQYARNAAAILDAWSSTLKTHQGANWYLQASWAGSSFPLGAELLRATYPGWSKAEIAQFKTMLDAAFLPLLHGRLAYGNREMSVINALMAIGVFNDDPAAFCEGLSHWRSYVPDYIYLRSDGPQPRQPDYWRTGPSDAALLAMDTGLFPASGNWITAPVAVIGDDHTMLTRRSVAQQWNNPGGPLSDGLSAETGRDLAHSELAMAAIFNAAQIAWEQGIDLFTPNRTRLSAFLERSASLRLGETLPGLYGGVLKANALQQSYEIGFSHLAHGPGSLPLTAKLLKTAIRPAATESAPLPPGIAATAITKPATLLSVWQTLTFAAKD